MTVPDHDHGTRGGLAADWSSINPIPRDRQLCIETDTLAIKLGDGATHYADLDYLINPTVLAALSGDVTTLTSGLAAETARAEAAEAAISVGLRFATAAAVATSNVASRSGTTTVDTVPLGVGAVVLLCAQTAGSQNGLWVIQSGAWTRPSNYATGNNAAGMAVYVEAGSAANVGTWAVSGAGPFTIDTNVTTWIQLSGLGDIILGNALGKTGTTLNVLTGTTSTTVAAGNDSRITGAAQKANNLSDLGSASTARTNLGLGSLATVTPTGTPNGTLFLRDDDTWATPTASASLTSASGAIGSNVTVGTSATVIQTTSSLAIGTWLLCAGAAMSVASGTSVDLWVETGTATATIAGRASASAQMNSSGGDADVFISVIVTVTVAGTLKIKGQGSASCTALAGSSVTSKTGATGYTAVKIA